MRKELLIFCGHYLPGYKAGGILRTVANMAINLSAKISLSIVTRDRDLGSKNQYKDINVNNWTKFNKYKVFYFSKQRMNIFSISYFFYKNKHRIFFFNSFFEKFTVYYFISSFFTSIFTKQKTIFLAPRGEFIDASFNVNKAKKVFYLIFFKSIYNHQNVHWIFSDNSEYQDFKLKFSIQINKHTVLNDIPTIYPLEIYKSNELNKSDKLKLVFISRVAPEKNVDIAIKIVQKTNRLIDFDIYGPISDVKYWGKCKNLIKNKSSNKIQYKGELLPNEVSKTFSKYDIFLFPTGGENFGHIIVESISQGTKVLISKNTPWKNLQEKGWGWDVPLGKLKIYTEILETYKIEDQEINIKKRKIIRKSFLEYLDLKSLVDKYLKVFNA